MCSAAHSRVLQRAAPVQVLRVFRCRTTRRCRRFRRCAASASACSSGTTDTGRAAAAPAASPRSTSARPSWWRGSPSSCCCRCGSLLQSFRFDSDSLKPALRQGQGQHRDNDVLVARFAKQPRLNSLFPLLSCLLLLPPPVQGQRWQDQAGGTTHQAAAAAGAACRLSTSWPTHRCCQAASP